MTRSKQARRRFDLTHPNPFDLDLAESLKESAAGRVQEVTSSAQESVATVRREGQSSADEDKEQARERM